MAGDYHVIEFVLGDGTVLKEVELVKFSVCYLLESVKIGFGLMTSSVESVKFGFGPMTVNVVGVVVSEGSCGRYL